MTDDRWLLLIALRSLLNTFKHENSIFFVIRNNYYILLHLNCLFLY